MAEGDALMLGVSGLRGVVGTTLTPQVIVRYTSAYAAWLHERVGPKRAPRVVLGSDGRVGGKAVYMLTFATLETSGCDVHELGVAMTPTVGVVVDQMNADGGLQVTASHNPQQWNGLKPIVRDLKARKGAVSASAPSKAIADQIIERYDASVSTFQPWDSFGHTEGSEEDTLIHERKVIDLLKDMGVLAAIKKAKFAVALDTVAGSGRLFGARFLEQLGCRVHELYPVKKNPDGIFPHAPEPTAANLKGLCAATKKSKAAVGFAQDPDADRLAIVDERGRYIGEEYTLVLAAKAMGEFGLLKKTSAMAVNLSTSRMIEDVAAAYGTRVIRTPVGEANVVDAMKLEGCIIGGEGNGGVIWPRVTYIRDSLSAMGLVLALMARAKQPLSELVDEVPAYAIEKQKFALARKQDARPAIEKIARAYRAERVDLQDGVRVDFPARCAWVHVRASNTEPIMRLIAEAPTQEAALGLMREVGGVLA